MPKDAHEMSENEIRARILALAFGGDERLFIAFYRKLQQGLPEGTGIVLRGSVVTNKRHEDGAPFDSQGKNTSDLDVTLVGSKVMELWNSDGYYLPGLHTKPLCDKKGMGGLVVVPAISPAVRSRHSIETVSLPPAVFVRHQMVTRDNVDHLYPNDTLLGVTHTY